MKWLYLIMCVIWIVLHYRSLHIYKSLQIHYSSEFGFALGTIIGAVLDGTAWYWMFKLLKLL